MSFKGRNHSDIPRIATINGIEYKLNRVIDETATSIHHIMGKCNRMKYNTNIEQNKVRIKDREHIALNNYFKEKQNPREQLQKVFQLVKPVLSIGVRKELEAILYEADDDLFYIPELLKK
jgi:predicted RNase H-like nuclease (RuvC/YqgF family)